MNCLNLAGALATVAFLGGAAQAQHHVSRAHHVARQGGLSLGSGAHGYSARGIVRRNYGSTVHGGYGIHGSLHRYSGGHGAVRAGGHVRIH